MKRLTLLLGVLVATLLTSALAQNSDTYVHQVFGEWDTLDPVNAYDTASGLVIENVYETLYSYQGDSITEYEPALATGYEISDDNLTYTYTLREGVSFHSGNPMTCADVEYSIERALVTNPGDSGAWILMEPLTGFYSNVASELGEDATDEDYAAAWETISNSVECLDETTVEFNLAQVDPAFFVKMMFYAAAIVDSEWAIDNGMWDGTEATWRDWVGVDLREHYLHNNVSGTGAYQVISAEPTTVVAEAFNGYWDEDASVQNVLIQVVDEESTRLLALQQGDADRITVNSWATIESQVRGLPGVVIHEDPTWTSLTVGAIHFVQDIELEDNPNVGSGQLDGNGIPADFFADENIRLAFAQSFDQDAFIEQLYVGNGSKLTMALPPSFLGYNEDLPVYSYDPEAAEEAFRAAFDGEVWENGFELTITYNTGNTTRQTIAEILKENIEILNPNFTINVRGIQWPDFLASRQAQREPVSIVGWVPDYADPDNYIYTFYHSGGYYGALLAYENEEMDALIDEARTITDSERRAEIYNQVGEIGYEDVPFLTYPTQQAFIVTGESVDGIYYNPMLSGQFLWKDISKN